MLQTHLDRLRSGARAGVGLQQDEESGEPLPGGGDVPTSWQQAGPQPGEGTRGAGPARSGETPRPGSGVIPGNESGIGKTTVPGRTARGAFSIDFKHETANAPRSHYVEDSRTIVVNLDHPQLAAASKSQGGLESRQFREIAYEVAFVEYAIALGREKIRYDPECDAEDALFDVREAINRVARLIPAAVS